MLFLKRCELDKIKILEYQEKYKEKTINLLIKVAVKEFGFEDGEKWFKIFENETYKDNDGICYIAIDTADNVIGTISLRKIDNLSGEVKNFYVEKEYRGTGIAQDLLNILVEFAKEKGYKRLELDSYKEFERAISFYEKNNFDLESVEDNKYIYSKTINEDKISIIVAIYNIEKYLDNCIKSIINQKYKNLQILLMDDGSTDSSGKICDKYAKIDKRIEVIHKENGGLADARNLGMSLAKGKFISFIDGDDYIYPSFYMDLYNAIERNNADISECDFLRINEDDIIKEDELIDKANEKLDIKEKILDGKEAINELFGTRLKPYVKKVVVWNKLYNANILKDIEFPFGKLHEDEYTTYTILNKAKKIVTTNKILHGYIQTKNSIMRREIKQKRIDDNLDAYIQSSKYFNNKNDIKTEMKCRRRYLENCIELSGKVAKSENKNKEEQLKDIQDKFIFNYDKYINDIIKNLDDYDNNVKERETRIINIIKNAYENIKTKNIGEYWQELEEFVGEK